MLQDDEIPEIGSANSISVFVFSALDWLCFWKVTWLPYCPLFEHIDLCISVPLCLAQVTPNPLTSWTIKERGVSLTHVLPTVAETQSEHKNHFTDCEGPPSSWPWHTPISWAPHTHTHSPLSWLLCPKWMSWRSVCVCVRTAGSLAPSVAAAPASGPQGGTGQIRGWLGWGEVCVCVHECVKGTCGPVCGLTFNEWANPLLCPISCIIFFFVASPSKSKRKHFFFPKWKIRMQYN